MANTSITKPTWLQIPDPINLLQPKYLSTPPTFPSSSSYKNRIFTVRSSSSNGSPKKSFNLKDALAGVVDERVDELMNSEENKIMLQGLEKASMRIEDCQKEISEAKAMVEEAERSLSQSEDGVISKDKERLESVKAASIAAIVGTLASLPISLTQVSTTSELILPLAITFASCALFGVTFRYTIRRDLDDVHLKTGAVAAFGVVKGLAALGEGQPLELNTESLLSHAFGGATFVSQNLLIFAFASIGLDYCFKARILSPFPMQKSISNTKDR
uniref:Uncharacterized protein n=1 Tax=Cannabis sativa TaxID=3483 RepID=A0A803PP53_CANSA